MVLARDHRQFGGAMFSSARTGLFVRILAASGIRGSGRTLGGLSSSGRRTLVTRALPAAFSHRQLLTGSTGIQSRRFAKMSEDRVVGYEEVVSYENNPDVYLIDVRDPPELKDTGTIAGSINIPLPELETTLKTMDDGEFKTKYGRGKPVADTEMVFSCKMGGRATKAMDTAIALGYNNSKVYKGSWLDYASKRG